MSLVIRDLEFSTNWNTRQREGREVGKLDCQCFTTIRIDSAKYELDAVYRIVRLNKAGNKNMGYARAQAVHRFRLGDMKDWLTFVDTGYSAAETRLIINRMYKTVTDATLMVCVLLRYMSEAEITALAEGGLWS